MIAMSETDAQVPALIDQDYNSFFHNAHLNYLCSQAWENIQTKFYRELLLHVAPEDWKVMGDYLRNQRNICLETFEKADCYFCWKKSYIPEEKRFDEITFIKKLYLTSDGKIEAKDLNDFFEYYCLTHVIETGLKKLLELEKSNYNGTINIFINQGEIIFEQDNIHKEEEQNSEEEEILKNIIFNSKIFDSNDRLLKLRVIIANSLDMDEYNNLFGKANNTQLDPTIKGEWYYILKAIEESEIAKRVSTKKFLQQMDSWFPWLFSYNNVEEMQEFYRKLEKSISHEKSLWKVGKAKDVVKLKDMWARINSLNMDYSKAERIYNAAYLGLCTQLIKYKQEIEKGKVFH